MAYIFSTGAVLRLLALRRDDPLVRWIEEERIRPFIALTTMASVRHEILTTDRVSADQRSILQKRCTALARDLTNGNRQEVTAAIFDMKSAEILADILPIDAGRDMLSDLDLVPAAIAIQHNLELVVADGIEAWTDLSAAIAPEHGRLTLRIHPPGTT